MLESHAVFLSVGKTMVYARLEKTCCALSNSSMDVRDHMLVRSGRVHVLADTVPGILPAALMQIDDEATTVLDEICDHLKVNRYAMGLAFAINGHVTRFVDGVRQGAYNPCWRRQDTIRCTLLANEHAIWKSDAIRASSVPVVVHAII